MAKLRMDKSELREMAVKLLSRYGVPEEDAVVVADSLIDADAEAFKPLSEAYGIPKDDPKRQEVMEAALLDDPCESGGPQIVVAGIGAGHDYNNTILTRMRCTCNAF